MANKIRFAIDNYIDSAYLTCTSYSDMAVKKDSTTLPVENIKYISKSRVLRTIDNTETSINGVIKTELPVSSLVLNGHNFTEGTTVTIYLYSDLEYTLLLGSESHVLTSDDCACLNTLTQTNLVLWFTEYASVRSFRIKFTNSGTPSLDYFQVSRVFLTAYVEADINVSRGNTIFWNSNTKQYRTEGGSLSSNTTKSVKAFNFELDLVSETKRPRIFKELAGVGMRKDFFFSIFPECTGDIVKDYSGLVKLKKPLAITEFQNNLYKSNFSLEEI